MGCADIQWSVTIHLKFIDSALPGLEEEWYTEREEDGEMHAKKERRKANAIYIVQSIRQFSSQGPC